MPTTLPGSRVDEAAQAAGSAYAAGPLLHELSATEAATAIRRKQVSPDELLEALLARIDTLEPQIQTWAHVDRDGARNHARRLADEALRGTLRGPLHGVPFAVKDVFSSAGVPTEAGSRVIAGFVPTSDATSIARLKKAGAILLGKVQTTEFAYYDPPPTRNPWNLEHTPGGSSSGSAPAVAARMVPATLGSQTAGSLIRPASFCGVAALKPSYGRISLHGVIPLTWIHDHVGIMARSVDDLALFLQAMAGHDPLDPTSAREPVPNYRASLERCVPPRIGVVRELVAQADSEVAARTEEAADRLALAGARVEEVALPPSFSSNAAVLWVTLLVGVAAIHADLHSERAELYRPTLRAHIEVGQLIPAELYLRALRIRRVLIHEIAAMLVGHDVLLTPATVTPAPKGLGSTGDPAFQFPWTLAGLPLATVPIGLSASGLPLGAQLIGGFYDEVRLLSAAAWCENVLGRLPAPPFVL